MPTPDYWIVDPIKTLDPPFEEVVRYTVRLARALVEGCQDSREQILNRCFGFIVACLTRHGLAGQELSDRALEIFTEAGVRVAHSYPPQPKPITPQMVYLSAGGVSASAYVRFTT